MSARFLFRLFAVLLLPVGLADFTRADITATVTLKGPPNSQDETFIANAHGCGDSSVRHTENWKVGPTGELAEVVVWIVDPRFGPTPPVAPEPEIKQLGCRYDPHVIAVVAAAPFKVLNGDPTLHNVLAKAFDGPTQTPGDTVFNLGQSYRGQIDERQFDTPGIYTLQCNVHSWMQAWVRALPTGCFAVTGTDGKADVQLSAKLLDGDYKIDAWHPRFVAPMEQTIHVKNGTAAAIFQFDGSKSL